MLKKQKPHPQPTHTYNESEDTLAWACCGASGCANAFLAQINQNIVQPWYKCMQMNDKSTNTVSKHMKENPHRTQK